MASLAHCCCGLRRACAHCAVGRRQQQQEQGARSSVAVWRRARPRSGHGRGHVIMPCSVGGLESRHMQGTAQSSVLALVGCACACLCVRTTCGLHNRPNTISRRRLSWWLICCVRVESRVCVITCRKRCGARAAGGSCGCSCCRAVRVCVRAPQAAMHTCTARCWHAEVPTAALRRCKAGRVCTSTRRAPFVLRVSTRALRCRDCFDSRSVLMH